LLARWGRREHTKGHPVSRTSTSQAFLAAAIAVGLLAGLAAVASGAGALSGGEPTPEDPGVAGAEDLEPVEVVEVVEVVPDQYVVTLDASIPPEDVPGAAQALADEVGGQVLAELPQSVNGFAIEVDAAGRAELEAAPEVATIADDAIVTGEAATVTDASPYDEGRPEEFWNLDRVSQRPLPRDGVYSYLHDGSGVHVYVLDSGIRPDNVFFGGRASIGTDVNIGPALLPANGVEHPSCTDPEPDPEVEQTPCTAYNTGGFDCQGHGTHVAGTVGADVYGVARGANIVAVRVLNCINSGTTSTVLAGIEWVLEQADTVGDDGVDSPTVINMSLSAPLSRGQTPENEPIAMAVDGAIDRGVVVVVAAGNNGGADACQTVPEDHPDPELEPSGRTPAFVPGAITVAASTQSDTRASFSNVGSCVDLVAPGDDIWSVSNVDIEGDYTDDAFISRKDGTSMATPAVSGAVAMLLEADPGLSPTEVRDALVDQATTGALGNLSSVNGSVPDRLLWIDGQTFGDVGGGNPFFADIEWMAGEGISTGTAASPKPLYKPVDPVSRQAMSAFMYRLAGEPAFPDPAEATFGDVSPANPFFTEIEWMAAEGVTTGTAASPKPLYKPVDPVSRQAMSAFMYRLAGKPLYAPPGPANTTFGDVSASHPFYDEIEWMASEGITTGTAASPKPLYKPGTPVSRQAMGAFMHRLADGPGVGI
jgi:subtilisin family serine protease